MTYSTTPKRGGSSLQFPSPAQLWLLSLLAVGAVLAGNMSLVRVSSAMPDVSVRTLFVVLGILVLAHAKKSAYQITKTKKSAKITVITTLSSLSVYAFILIHLSLSDLTDRTISLMAEYTLGFLTLVLLGGTCFLHGKTIAIRFSIVCGSLGGLWGVAFILRLLSGAISQEAIPFATPFTFYRVELLGFFCALYLAQALPAWCLAWYAISFICLTACLASMAKAAWIAVLISGLMLIFCNWVWGSTRSAIRVLVVLLAATISSYALSGAMLSSRISHGVLGTGYEILDVGKKFATPTPTPIPTPERSVIAAFHAINGRHTADWLKIDPQLRDEIEVFRERVVILPDLSYRTRLLWHGIIGALEKKWLGQGFSTFKMETKNLYTRETEIYHYPHNIALEFLYSGGIVGAAVAFFAILTPFGMMLKQSSSKRHPLPFLCAALGLGVGSMVGGSIIDLAVLWASLILAATVTPPPTRTQDTSSRPNIDRYTLRENISTAPYDSSVHR